MAASRPLSRYVGELTLRLVSLLPAPILRIALGTVERVPLVRRIVSPLATPGHGARATIRHGVAAGISFSPGAGALVYASGRMEPHVQQAIREHLRPGDVFFDVGANVGFYTLVAARAVGEEGRVVAFEPNPVNLRGLAENIAANEFSNVTVVRKAVSARSGEGRLDAAIPSSSTVVDDARAGAIAVALVALDDFVAENPELSPNLVKIDAEGHEREVLDGMKRILATTRPALVVEMHGTNHEVGRGLRAHEYVLETLEVDEPLERAPGWVHVFAAPAESIATE